MSDDTMSTAASASALSAPSAQQSPAAQPVPRTRHDFSSDKEMMLAAIARMEVAVRSEHAAHERLRADLASMAEAIAHVKTSLRNAATSGKPVNVSVLLTWLEARVHGMREFLDPPEALTHPTIEPSGEPDATAEVQDAVPTVSEVVSRLGRASEVMAQDADSLEQSAGAAGGDVPTPAMIGAMVEALTAYDPVEPDAPTPAAVEQAEAAPEAAAIETFAAQEAIQESVPEFEPETVEPEDVEFELAPELLISGAPADEADASEEADAHDATTEVTAFAAELGATETVAHEIQSPPADLEQASAETATEILAAAQDLVSIESEPEEADIETPAAATLTDALPADAVPEPPVEIPASVESEATVEADEPVTLEIAGVTTGPAITAQISEETLAVPAVPSPQNETGPQESDLLSSFAAMEAMPFMPDEIGTAVIFETRLEFDPAAEQTAFEAPARPDTSAQRIESVAEPEAIASESALTATSAHESSDTETASAEAAVATHESPTAAAPGKLAVYAGMSTLSVSLGASAIPEMKPETVIGASEASPPEDNAKPVPAAESAAITAAEAALAQARAELAAAAALLDIGKPRLELVAAEESASDASPQAADDDLDDLFEPEPDSALDPNAVLLGPAPAFTLDPATAAVLPAHDMTLNTSSAETVKAPETKPAAAANANMVKTIASGDPLAPLKALSDEEKIALFS